MTTATQKLALENLAQVHGMRLLTSATQVAIGYRGQAAFEAVYTFTARPGHRWAIRNRSTGLALAKEMRAILAA